MRNSWMLTKTPLKFLFVFSLVGILLTFFYVNSPILPEAKKSTESSYSKELQAKLDEVKEKIKATQDELSTIKANKAQELQKISGIEREIKELEFDIKELNEQIAEKELVIEKLEVEINLLDEQMKNLKIDIKDSEEQIEKLEKETDQRLMNMYISQKQNITTSSSLFSADNPSVLVKNDTYRKAFQEDTNIKLTELEETRTQLEKDKAQVEDNKVSIERNRQQLVDEKIAIDTNRVKADQQRTAFFQKKQQSQKQVLAWDELSGVLSQKEKELLAEQDKIQAMMLSRNEVANGVPIKKGTFIGVEGNTGYSYGAHLHFGVSENGVIQNPCNYLSAYGCGGNGSLETPLKGAVLTSGFRTKSRPSHNAIDVSTGGGGSVVAAHDGYVYFFFESCKGAAVCNGGGAIVAKVCEVNKCTSGTTTVYYHLKCTAEPSSSPRSCKK